MEAAREYGPVVHSVVEASLYLMVTPCPNCGRGPVRTDTSSGPTELDDVKRTFRLAGDCASCQASWNARFILSDAVRVAHAGFAESPGQINPTDTPSSVVDVAQWLTLCRMLTAEADACSDRIRGRELKVLAGRCIDEAIKFFKDAASDLPSPTAFFHDETRRVFRENPQEFTRARLLDRRAKLPSPIPKR